MARYEVRCEECVYGYRCERRFWGSCDCGVAWGEGSKGQEVLDLKEEKDGGEDAKVE